MRKVQSGEIEKNSEYESREDCRVGKLRRLLSWGKLRSFRVGRLRRMQSGEVEKTAEYRKVEKIS